MPHVYSEKFFDYIDDGARRSARLILSLIQQWIEIDSVVDFGCGRGAWLAEWQAAGIDDIQGLDGTYVDLGSLAIAKERFKGVDLTQSVDLGRRFDLAQSLEVGEHLPPEASAVLVRGLTRHSDRVLFSAAVPGQGGEFHINEQPLAYWQELFEERGYSAYDCLRPVLGEYREIESWYRYNSVLYANEAGARHLPDDVRASRVSPGRLAEMGSPAWLLRRHLVRRLPQGVVTRIAQLRASVLARRFRALR